MEDEKETIYVPVSNSDSALRPCLTEENAWKLIEKIPEISTPWTENEKMREQKYKEAIKANDPKALVVIIKMIYQRKQQRLAQGKKCTATDTKYFQIAEKLLYEELEQPLGSRSRRSSTRSLSILDKTLFDFFGKQEISLLMNE